MRVRTLFKSLQLMLIFLLLYPLSYMPVFADEPPSEPILRIESGMHTARIDRIDVDASNRYLVTASQDKTIGVWEVSTGRLIRKLRPPVGAGFEGMIYAVAISPDGNTVAAGGWTGYEWDGSGSIYLFDRTSGRLTQRINGLPDLISHLAYSNDGKVLVACLAKQGIRLYRTPDYNLIGEDLGYGSESNGASFDQSGHLVTTSSDGYIRLYDTHGESLKLIAKEKGRGGTRPASVKFSPSSSSDDAKIAVGYLDSAKIDILSGKNLSYLYSPDTDSVNGINLASVTWSSDGQILYAGGTYEKILKWSNQGRGQDNKPKELEAVDNASTITHILPLNNGDIAFGATGPYFGIIDAFDKRKVFQRPDIIHHKNSRKAFLISYDGLTIQFAYEHGGEVPATFSINENLLTTESKDRSVGLTPPIILSSDIWITNMNHTTVPKLNGVELEIDEPNNVYRNFAIHPSREGFLLGSDRYLYVFAGDGKQLGQIPVPGAVWAVNISRNGKLVVAALGDGTIRWYEMDNGHELLAFFPHSDRKRWVMWTPEGFFDASPGGEQLIGYHINQGKDREAVFISIDKLYRIFYRPDLVQAKIQGKDISEYAKAADIAKIIKDGGLPPTIKFSTFPGNLAKKDITIDAQICDQGGGIGDITLFLNDMPISVDKEGRGLKITGTVPSSMEKCQSFSHLITLQHGENNISLMAYNKANIIESEKDTVKLTYHSSAAEKTSLHILAVAIDQYRDGDLRLKYAKNDAEAIGVTLKEQAKNLFEHIHIYPLYNEEVTKEGLSMAFEKIGAKTKREDVFIFFLSGHGVTNEKDGSYYFLPVNFRYTGEAAVLTQGISMNDFKQYLTSIEATKSLILLDTCNSGSFIEAIASRGIVEKTAISRLTRAVGRATIVASRQNEVALEGYEGHGFFTYTVLQALKGAAADKEGIITVNRIATHVADALPKITQKTRGYEQIPQQDLHGMDFPIGIMK